MKGYIILILGFAILIPANWPSIGLQYFPYNLPFCFIGGGLMGWGAAQVVQKLIK